MQNVIVPNKLAELVNFLHFLLHTYILPIPLTPHTSLCTHLIHNWHGSSLRPGKQCKAKQRNDSNKVRPHFAIFYFPFYLTFLFRHFFSLSISFDFFNYNFFYYLFFLVYFRKLFAARVVDFLLSFSAAAAASAVVVCTKYNGEMLNLCCRSMQFICGKVPTRRRR